MTTEEDLRAIFAFLPFAILGTLSMLLWHPLHAWFGTPVAVIATVILCGAASIITAVKLAATSPASSRHG